MHKVKRTMMPCPGSSCWNGGVTNTAMVHFQRWGGPKRENRAKRDGTGKCYRWLAKGDLMTKTGYGYAKCLTVAGTATTCGQDCGHEKCGSCTLTQGPRYIAEI